MAKRTKPAIDAVEILHRRFYAGKATRLKNLEVARANEEVARKIHELRTAAGLTQTRLARLIGTRASVICRLEDADYEGHSLANAGRPGRICMIARPFGTGNGVGTAGVVTEYRKPLLLAR